VSNKEPLSDADFYEDVLAILTSVRASLAALESVVRDRLRQAAAESHV
jgi:hypothetical protein